MILALVIIAFLLLGVGLWIAVYAWHNAGKIETKGGDDRRRWKRWKR